MLIESLDWFSAEVVSWLRAKNRSFPKTKIKRLRIGQSGVNDDDVLLIHLDVVFRKRCGVGCDDHVRKGILLEGCNGVKVRFDASFDVW